MDQRNFPRITSNERALWEYIMHQERTVYGNKNAIPTPGFLRSEVKLGTASQISFGLLANEQNQGQDIMPMEQRLQQNDAFYVTQTALMFYTYIPGDGSTSEVALRAAAKLHQYPALEFAANQPSIRAAYVGKYSLAQNEKIFVRDLDAFSMQYADTAQEGLVTGDGSTAYAQDAILGNKGWRNMENPMIRLNGQSNVDATLRLPLAIPFDLVEGSQVVAVLYKRGWRTQNAGVARVAE